jgi:hypothetical protein
MGDFLAVFGRFDLQTPRARVCFGIDGFTSVIPEAVERENPAQLNMDRSDSNMVWFSTLLPDGPR